MFLWLKTLYRKRAVTWPFIFYTIIWTLSKILLENIKTKKVFISYSWSNEEHKERVIRLAEELVNLGSLSDIIEGEPIKNVGELHQHQNV